MLVVVPSIQQTLTSDKPAGEDWNRHAVWLRQYSFGSIKPLESYPPIFHILMFPFYMSVGYPNIRFFQPFFALISILVFVLLAKKTMSLEGTLISSFMIVTSHYFVMFAGALLPQTIDYILIPVCALLFWNKKYKLTAFLLWLLLGVHSFGIFIFTMFFVYSLIVDKKFIRYLIVVFICGLVFLPSFMDMTALLTTAGRWEEEKMVFGVSFFDRWQMWTTPWDDFLLYPITHFVLFSGYLIWFLLPLTIYSMYKIPKYNKYQLFYVVWFFTIIPLVFFNALRFWSYAVIPISLFCGSVIGKYLKRVEDDNRKKN